MPSSGVTISVTAETNAGGRKHMEDYIAVNLSPNSTLRDMPDMKEQAYVGVFDGHGGKEAAKFAREELWEVIQNKANFLSHDVSNVKEAIREAYIDLHQKMKDFRHTWQPNKTGDLSTAGTTACTVIFRKNRIFVANVGDSTAIMGIRNPHYGQPGEPQLIAKVISRDHKPEDPLEQQHIRELGGDVALSPKGVMRVVWERLRNKSDGCTEVDRIPFLSVARSLGDFWSFNPRTEQYTVSPEPDVSVIPLDLSVQKFVVIASDGLWNVMTPNEVVSFIDDYHTQQDDNCHQPKDVVSCLIREALDRWNMKRLQADNIAILIAFLSEEEPKKCKTSGLQSSSTTPDKTEAIPSSSITTTDPVIESRAARSPSPPTTDPIPSSSTSVPSPDLTPAGVPDLSTTPNTDFETVKKRKHKKHRRQTWHRYRPSMMACSHHSVVLQPVPDQTDPDSNRMALESNQTDIPSLNQEFSMFGTVNGVKRSHPDDANEEEDDDDEGIMIPSSQKRIRGDNLVILRSQRLSTDAGSDSGSSSNSSSGVSSDSNVEEGMPDPASVVDDGLDLIMEIEVDEDIPPLHPLPPVNAS